MGEQRGGKSQRELVFVGQRLIDPQKVRLECKISSIDIILYSWACYKSSESTALIKAELLPLLNPGIPTKTLYGKLTYIQSLSGT